MLCIFYTILHKNEKCHGHIFRCVHSFAFLSVILWIYHSEVVGSNLHHSINCLISTTALIASISLLVIAFNIIFWRLKEPENEIYGSPLYSSFSEQLLTEELALTYLLPYASHEESWCSPLFMRRCGMINCEWRRKRQSYSVQNCGFLPKRTVNIERETPNI